MVEYIDEVFVTVGDDDDVHNSPKGVQDFAAIMADDNHLYTTAGNIHDFALIMEANGEDDDNVFLTTGDN